MNYPYSGEFRLVSPYGMRRDPVSGDCAIHTGIDLVGVHSKKITAVCGGTVLRSRMVSDTSDRTWEWGNYIAILGDDGMTAYYCHLSERYVNVGDRLEAGSIIGMEGSSGRSTGSHLHFEVRRGADAVNAAGYLGLPNKAGSYAGNAYAADMDAVSPWARDDVRWAMDAGLLVGLGGGCIGPDKPCTREQMCVFMRRLYGLMTDGKNGTAE